MCITLIQSTLFAFLLNIYDFAYLFACTFRIP